VALVAALLGHVTIDILGDYLLPHDTYDDVSHSSRAIVALITLGAALFGIVLSLRALVREACGSENAFCSSLRRALPAHVPLFVLGTIAASTVVLCAMEAGDALVAGQAIDDLGDLFGGSIASGGTIVASIAALTALIAVAALRRLARTRLVAALRCAFLRRNTPTISSAVARMSVRRRPLVRDLDLCHRIAGRAPPLFRPAITI
jgi:hypothetical protein